MKQTILAEIERRRDICKGIFEIHSDTYYQGKSVAYNEVLSFINSLPDEECSAHENNFVSNDGLEEAARLYAIPHYMKDIDKSHINEYPYDSGLEYAFISGAKWQKEKDKTLIKEAHDFGFGAGSEWQKEQMMKEEVEGQQRLSVDELRESLLERDYENTAFFINPDFIDAIIGITDDGRLVYSYGKMVESLMNGDDMSYEDAVEFIDYNTVRTVPYMGECSPIIVYYLFD